MTRPNVGTLPQRVRSTIIAVGPPAIAILTLLGLWELVSRASIVDPIVLPAPTTIADRFATLVTEPFFWDEAKVTAWETVAGYAIGVGAALTLGTITGLVDFVRRSLYPTAVAIQTVPSVAFAPLFLVWFGFGLTPRIMFAVAVCFFPIFLSVIVGLQNVDADARTLLRSFGASRWQIYRKLAVRSAMPVVFGALKYGATLALIGAIVGEFVGGDRGLGVLIQRFNAQLDIAGAFATIAALSVFGMCLYGLIDFIDKKVVFWRGR